MIIHFLILSFGFVFTHRIIQIQIDRKPLSEAISKRIIKTLIVYLWFLTVLSPWIPIPIYLFFIFVPNLAAARLDWIVNFILRQKFRENLLTFTDELILIMLSGKSFRDSYLQLTSNSHDFFQFKMRELLLAGKIQHSVENQKEKLLIPVLKLVQTIEKNPHKSLDRMKTFRRQLYWNISFQKKSKQVTAQIRTQALILSILYFSLMIFMLLSEEHVSLILILVSLFLFFLGILILFLIGRRKKWKT